MLEKLKAHEKYDDFIVPIDGKTEFRDATYFLRKDGVFVFGEGYCHTPGMPLRERRVVSHLVLIPLKGNPPEYTRKTIFGQKYENVTKEIMSTQPLERFYPLQFERYIEVDPSLNVERPPYAKYKVLVPVDSLVGHFPHRHVMKAIAARADSGDESAGRIIRAIECSAELLGISPDRFGMSGSISLGTYDNPHDLDVVIYGSVKEVRRIVDFLYKLTATEEKRKVFEFGKFWPLRYWEHVEGRKLMFCPFFSYLDLDECPLRDFTCEVIAQVKIEGRVADHTHNAFNPTLLLLDRVTIDGKERAGELRLILYHGGERGDYVEGDRIAGEAALVAVRTFKGEGKERHPDEEYEAALTTRLGEVKKVE